MPTTVSITKEVSETQHPPTPREAATRAKSRLAPRGFAVQTGLKAGECWIMDPNGHCFLSNPWG